MASQERGLVVEERKMLNGCRLLDASLDSLRSIVVYKKYLMGAVPLIHGTLEDLGEDSAVILQLFF